MMSEKIILLVEDNPDDILLTQRTLKKTKVLNDLVVAHDGVEALEYLLGEGEYEGRDTNIQPEVILLDLKYATIRRVRNLATHSR